MLLIDCPYCQEKRPEIEFTYGGEAHITRPQDPSVINDQDWSEYLFVRENSRGIHYERWIHSHGCARFFNAVRDTVTDKFVMTYKSDEPKPTKAQIATRLAIKNASQASRLNSEQE